MRACWYEDLFRAGASLLCFLSLTTTYHPAVAQTAFADSALSLSSTATRRFVAAHGRRSVVMGYPQNGLEVWAYPLQILAGYQIGFTPEGATTETDGRLLLSRVIEKPDSVVRIYAGPDYLVRETLFVPLNQPAAILSYEVKAQRPVNIDVHFAPVLNLMWPGALGGQSAEWFQNVPGYLLSEPAHGLSAVVSSPEIVSHDVPVNSASPPEKKLSFAVRPRASTGAAALATVYIALLDTKHGDATASVRALAGQKTAMEAEAAAHYHELAQHALRIQTPDEEVNSALAWSEVALDQAWVCNPQLGCGEVAGYGPSRPERRPQYDWFFAGDGLVAVNALVSVGEYARAREELEFIAKYQDAKSGMVWHELSQSAGYIDWSKYPYMFVHVDITFDYLIGVARYVAVSGDTKFATEHWPSIASAWSYCRSLISASDHLPHIPSGKEGGDEQHRPADDLGLSTSWVAAARSFAELARETGHAAMADEAMRENQLASQSVAAHYWDESQKFWIDGHTATGEPIFTRHSGPGAAITEKIFSLQQKDELLDQIASAKFQTDWGVRGTATDSSIYDPWSYATGSVSALHSANTAAMFWPEHRPDTAWPLWRAILPWNTLDALGHLHEVLAGNFYREQTESVPEQTWSSAGLLDAAVRGMLGIEVHGVTNSAAFRPHLPAEWSGISVDNLRLPHSVLALGMTQSIDGVDLEIKDEGVATALLFEPQIPLGAVVSGAECAGHAVPAKVERFAGDEHVRLEVQAPSGSSRCHFSFSGGVAVIPPQVTSQVGDSSAGMKVIRVQLEGRKLSVDADVSSAGDAVFRIRTSWKATVATGATLHSLGGDVYEVRMQIPPSDETGGTYSRAHAEIDFTDRDR